MNSKYMTVDLVVRREGSNDEVVGRIKAYVLPNGRIGDIVGRLINSDESMYPCPPLDVIKKAKGYVAYIY